MTNPEKGEMKTAEDQTLQVLQGVLRAIENETVPFNGHADPLAINDCWNTVRDCIEELYAHQRTTQQGELKNHLMQQIRQETPQSIIKEMDLKEKIQQEELAKKATDYLLSNGGYSRKFIAPSYEIILAYTDGYESATTCAQKQADEVKRLREALTRIVSLSTGRIKNIALEALNQKTEE